MEIASCDSAEALDLLAIDFTASHAHFGSLKTVELERGGHEKRVTISNRYEFISKLCHWHLIGTYVNHCRQSAGDVYTCITHLHITILSI